MAAVVNYRDILLEATDPRILPVTLPPNVTVPVDSVPGLGDLAGQDTVDVSNFASTIAPIGIVAALPVVAGYTGPKVVLLTTDGKLYRISGTAWTAVVNTGDLVGAITSTQMGPGSVTTPALAANSVTANAMAANSVVFGTIAAGAVSAAQVVAGSLTADRLDTRNLTVRDASGNIIFGAGVKLATANISGLGALATASTVNLASQVAGQLASGNVNGLGALALLNTVNLSTQVTGALNGQTQVTNLGTLAYANAIAANQIGAGTLAAGVVYAGAVNASQVNAGILSGVLLQVGTGNSPGGRSLEIQANGAIYADNLFAGFAIFSNTDAPGNVPVAASSYGDVVAFWATAEQSTSNCHAIRGKNLAVGASGLVGTASNYAFYAEAGTHGPFTGSHDALVPNSTSVAPGDIVADVRCLSRAGWSNTIFEVATSVRVSQTGVLGVVSFVSGPLSAQVPAALLDDAGEPTSDYARLKDEYTVIVVNALGEGQMNVCGEGGDILAGDLIVTSSTPGKGMKQADDIVRSCTVARAREAVMFASPTEIKAIACTYHCG
jgi:hypothetical protein